MADQHITQPGWQPTTALAFNIYNAILDGSNESHEVYNQEARLTRSKNVTRPFLDVMERCTLLV